MIKEELRALYFRYRLFVWPVFALIFIGVLVGVSIFPQVQTLFTVQTKIEQEEARLNALQTKAKVLQAIDNREYQKNIELTFTALPEDKDVLQAMIVFQYLAQESGILWQGARSGAQSQALGVTTTRGSYQLTLSVLGTKAAFQRFIESLQKSPRVVKVQLISQHLAKDNRLSAEVVVDVFYEQAPRDIGSIDKQVPSLNQNDQKIIEFLSALPNPFATSSAVFNIPLGKPNPFD